MRLLLLAATASRIDDADPGHGVALQAHDEASEPNGRALVTTGGSITSHALELPFDVGLDPEGASLLEGFRGHLVDAFVVQILLRRMIDFFEALSASRLGGTLIEDLKRGGNRRSPVLDIDKIQCIGPKHTVVFVVFFGEQSGKSPVVLSRTRAGRGRRGGPSASACSVLRPQETTQRCALSRRWVAPASGAIDCTGSATPSPYPPRWDAVDRTPTRTAASSVGVLATPAPRSTCRQRARFFSGRPASSRSRSRSYQQPAAVRTQYPTVGSVAIANDSLAQPIGLGASHSDRC